MQTQKNNDTGGAVGSKRYPRTKHLETHGMPTEHTTQDLQYLGKPEQRIANFGTDPQSVTGSVPWHKV